MKHTNENIEIMFENIRTYHKEFGIPEGTMKFVVSVFKFYKDKQYLSPKQFKALEDINAKCFDALDRLHNSTYGF